MCIPLNGGWAIDSESAFDSHASLVSDVRIRRGGRKLAIHYYRGYNTSLLRLVL